MPGWLTDSQFLVRVPAVFRTAASEAPPGWLEAVASDCNALAADWIRGVLGARGLSPAQMDAWPAGPAWQSALALFFLSEQARLDLNAPNEPAFSRADPRDSFKATMVTDAASGKVVAGANPGAISHGRMKTTQGVELRRPRGENFTDPATGDLRPT
jgi:hypothetical protein